MSADRKLPKKSERAEVDNFLRKVAMTPVAPAGAGRGRLMFAMDATASRQPTWDSACHLQAEMFKETKALGGLEVQLLYYRGYRECKASRWTKDPSELLRIMTSVTCLAGHTQVLRVLKRAIKETKEKKVAALVFVGDAIEEDIDDLGHVAGQLGILGLPCFMFHEGHDPAARNAFQQIAKLSGGAYAPFDAGSAKQLRDLLSAVAVYAAGGRPALSDFSKQRGGIVPQLTYQVKS
ncbi:MAG: VWA domain-containing protein [Kiloniellales bacterium]|nr:VWA domain-containing protein [Kiloniellales bacterium]